MDEIKKSFDFKPFIVFFFIIIVIIFLIILYIKKNSNNIEQFKTNENPYPKSSILEQIKKIKNENENNISRIDKNFFEDITQANVINDIKNNIDQIQYNLKTYKEEDVKYIKTKLDEIYNQIEKNNSVETFEEKPTPEKIVVEEPNEKNEDSDSSSVDIVQI